MKFKSVVSLLLVVSLLAVPTSAVNISGSIEYVSVEDEIDSLFSQMNEICAEAALFRQISQGLGHSRASIESAEKGFQERIDALATRLEGLGVKRIDPEDKEAVAQLKNIVNSAKTNENTARDSVNDPPDFDMFLDAYSVFQVNATWTVDGQAIPYSAIRIVDNKGYTNSPLTKIQVHSLINQTSTNVSNLLSYTFSFALSQYLGTIPYGWAADWTLGAVFECFDGVNGNNSVSVTGNKPIYTTQVVSVTEMLYCYVYNQAGVWDLCGVKANAISYSRMDTFAGNIAGAAITESENYPIVTSSTGIPLTDYITNYVRYGYRQTHYPGELYINGIGNAKYNITPGFASLPSKLY